MTLMEAFVKIGCDTSDLESGLDSIGGKLSSGLGAIAKAGAAAVGAATGAFVGFTKQAVDVGAAFDASMSNVAAISGATAEEFDQLREKALEMGANTKFSATEAADAFSYMSMAGWKAEDMLNGIEGLMSLAAASGEDLANTSDIVTDALTAFGQGADQAGRLADIMAAASSNANTNVHLMGETFKYVAPLAGSMGYGMEDTAVAIGLMANAGIKGSQAGTALRSIMTRMAKPTKESATAMAALGISLDDGSGNMYSFMEVMEQMRDGFHNKLMIPEEEFKNSLAELNQNLEDGTMTQERYDAALAQLTNRAYGAEGAMMAQYAAMLGGQEAMSGLLAIVNASESDFNKLTGAIENGTGAAEEMSKKMMDNLAGDLEYFKSALGTAKITLSDSLTPSLREFVQLGTDGLSAVTNAFKEGGLDAAITAVGTWISDGLSVVVNALDRAISVGASILTSLIDGITQNIPQLAEAATSIVVSFADFLVEGLPQLALSAFTLISELAGGIGQALPELVPKAVEAILTFTESLIENLPAVVDAALQLMTGLGEGIVRSIPLIIQKIPQLIESLVSTILDSIPRIGEAGGELLGSLFRNLPAITANVIKAIPTLIGSIVKAILGGGPSIISAGINLIGGLGQGIIDGARNVIERARQVAADVLSAIKGFFGIASPSRVMRYEVGQQIGEGTVLGIEDKFAKIKGTMADMGDIVTGSSVGSGVPVQGGSNARIEQLLMTIIESMQRFGVTIDGKVLAGYLAPVIDDYLGTVVDNLQREAVTV